MTNQEILVFLNPIFSEHFKKAMEIIDKKGIPKGRGSNSYDVFNEETGKKYPPPYLIELAYNVATGLNLPDRFFDKIKKDGPHFKKIESFGFKVIEKKLAISDIIERYKIYINKTKMLDEVYKWKLVKEFVGQPNIDAKDFNKEIHNIKFENLIYTLSSGVLRHIAKTQPEELRKSFKHLFDENLDLESRMMQFQQSTLAVYRAMGETNSHHQDERSMASYLTYHNPTKYTFYKSSFYKPFCQLMGVQQAGKLKKYIHYLELLNEFISKYIAVDVELIELVKSYIPDYYDGSNHLLLAQDILYSMLNKEDIENLDEIGERYWIYAPGKKAIKWDEFYQNGIIALGWDELGDLNQYKTQVEIANQLRVIENSKSLKTNDAKANFDFIYNLKIGDIVFVKKGNSTLLGYGIIKGPLVYDVNRVDYKNYRNVEWKLKGEWDPEHTLVQKTLTDITDFPTSKEEFSHYYERLFACMGINVNQAIPKTESIVTSFDFITKSSGLNFSEQLIQRFIASLCTKPFVICSGLSGSGKTKLAQAFAQWICYKEAEGEKNEQYCIVPVGADWTNREPLLGYPNALQKSNYVSPENGVLDLIIRARLNVSKPYFLILDEMNLSHVERYFADFLSTMESGDSIPLHTIDDEESGIPKQIKLPKNLFIIGTVNIDETTYMFSPKVLDRANTIEFRLSDDDLSTFIDSDVSLDLNVLKGVGENMGECFVAMATQKSDKNLKKTQEDLMKFFKELKKSGAEFGYRTASEIGRLMFMLQELGEKGDNLLDIAIMQKLLPKLHGSRNKLTKVLPILGSFCLKKDADKIKEEYLDKFLNNSFIEEEFKMNKNIKYPISFEKICRMYKNAIENGFASYAEA